MSNIDWSQVKTAEAKATEATEQALQAARNARARAYQEEADPLFFKAQRGEADLLSWQAKVDEIRTRYPYPEGSHF
jgi:hypothetical protein